MNKPMRKRELQFELIGGAVCLDYANTLDDRFTTHPKELMNSYVDLVQFAEETGVLSEKEGRHLLHASAQQNEVADRTLKQAIRIREAIFAVFWAIVQKRPVPKAAVGALNRYVREAMRHARLMPGKGHFQWEFEPAAGSLDAPLWPIVRSAADLLSSDQLQFVRACASKTCDWLFLDESKNHRRRWCDMTKCGNREKVRSFYSRQKTEDAP